VPFVVVESVKVSCTAADEVELDGVPPLPLPPPPEIVNKKAHEWLEEAVFTSKTTLPDAADVTVSVPPAVSVVGLAVAPSVQVTAVLPSGPVMAMLVHDTPEEFRMV